MEEAGHLRSQAFALVNDTLLFITKKIWHMIIKTQEQTISQVVYSVTIFTAGISGGKDSSSPANCTILSNCSSSSLPTTSLSILPLLLLYNLGIGVEGALVSFCSLEPTHELVLVSLERKSITVANRV